MKIKTDQSIMLDRAKITRTISDFWNKTTEGWRTLWGPHIHHGYYENTTLTPIEAQEKMIEKLAGMLVIAPNDRIIDVGCGMGGSSLYLAKKYQASVTGITLSQKQVAIATQLAKENGLQKVTFKIEDALSLESFANSSCDIVWSLESCEQFFDKHLFLQQANRVLKPSGKIMLATWCSDRDEYEGHLAKKYRKLCYAFDLPYMPTIAHYTTLLKRNGFEIEEEFDWTTYVERSWEIGLSQAKAYSFWQLFKLGGLRGIRFLKQSRMMRDAFQEQRVRYGVFLARKI